MDENGKINDLGKQYIGAERPLVTGLASANGAGGDSVSSSRMGLSLWLTVVMFSAIVIALR